MRTTLSNMTIVSSTSLEAAERFQQATRANPTAQAVVDATSTLNSTSLSRCIRLRLLTFSASCPWLRPLGLVRTSRAIGQIVGVDQKPPPLPHARTPSQPSTVLQGCHRCSLHLVKAGTSFFSSCSNPPLVTPSP